MIAMFGPGGRLKSIAAVGVATLLAIALPANAQYWRGCNAELVFTLPSPLGEASFQFRVERRVALYTQVGAARRMARSRIVECLREHWTVRSSDTRPLACTDDDRWNYDFIDYPFDHFEGALREAVCALVPAGQGTTVDIGVYITGNTDGCVRSDANMDPYDYERIASEVPVLCPFMVDPGMMIDPRDIQRIEPEQPPEQPPLPYTRLPSNDLRQVVMADDQDWQACWQACEDAAEEGCTAWTYRAPGTSGTVHGGAGLCLLKTGVGEMVSDPCCHSGTR